MYTFLKDKILDERGREVMMDWETPIMKEHAKIVTENGGDILEIGFGMGICSNFIQKANINTHTIIEINDQIFKRLLKWAKDKPNVIPIKGDWFNSIPKNKKYNGIMHDTWEEKNYKSLYQIIPSILKPKGIFTYYTPNTGEVIKHNSKTKYKWGTVNITKINIDPPIKEMNYKYFTRKDYYVPKITID
jgi:guanidinoacetate N-methyltransferase